MHASRQAPDGSSQDLVRVRAVVGDDDPWGVKTEGLWAEHITEETYRLVNTPWHARGLNWGDRVRCVGDPTETQPEIVEVVEPSGHLSFAVVFFAEVPDAERDGILQTLNDLGASYEWYTVGGSSRLYAIDVPPEVDWRKVYEYLQRREDGDRLGFQTSWSDAQPHPRTHSL